MSSVIKKYDVAVIGGGISGICAAIAAAREGAGVALVQDRPVLGGNASSEIRMHIVGASRHGQRADLRETGIIDEILLENKYRNPEYSYGIFDIILWEKVKAEKNIELFLNTYVYSVNKLGNRIASVNARQITTEKEFVIESDMFIDCTGDGSVSCLAGAEIMFGRESRDTFGEPNAPAVSDTVTMGNSIQFQSVDAGHPVPFERPQWAYDYSNAAWAKKQQWLDITAGFWWVEIGGTEWNCISDAELTRDEMLKIIFGIWDYLKNHSEKKHELRNYYLDWIGFLPGKRESRRVRGDYVLNENDVLANRVFDDAIAYGGWHLDAHRPEGFYALINDKPWNSDRAVHFDGIYTIPYRCIYAKGIENLFLGGRVISASHRAFSSTRVMGTCAVVSEAAGVAAAMAVKKRISPKDVICHIGELQQTLMRNGCYIPAFKNEDADDMARDAKAYASSDSCGYDAKNVINGISRPVGKESNMWQGERLGAHISLRFGEEKPVSSIHITFDAGLSREISQSISQWCKDRQSAGVPDTIVKAYTLSYFRGGEKVAEVSVENNHQGRNRIQKNVLCDEIRVKVNETHGYEKPRICEIRVY